MVYTRKNVTKLSSAERKRFVNAVLALKRKGRYDEFVRVHIDYYVADGDTNRRVAHMAPSFLPWHRRFLLEFERALQREAPGVTVPYWDWTAARSPVGSPWTDDLLGGTGRGTERRVATGPFARANGWIVRENITDDDFLVRDLGRPSNPFALPSKDELALAMRESVYDVEPWNSTVSSGFRNGLEGWTGVRTGDGRWRNHNRVHRWVGGTMLGGASVNDPVFWLHHSFVDLLWSRWRKAHPDGAYEPAEPPGFGSLERGRIVARNERMPPWDVTPASLEQHGGIYRYA
ncbi:tyrosinase family protein [Streptomyces sp. NPDC127068]|uniref:tyrosinase family protein n=1 Tax=Streptomyces sp. NPDC127068 TaxID=3347127 RepID=UPI003648EF1B